MSFSMGSGSRSLFPVAGSPMVRQCTATPGPHSPSGVEGAPISPSLFDAGFDPRASMSARESQALTASLRSSAGSESRGSVTVVGFLDLNDEAAPNEASDAAVRLLDLTNEAALDIAAAAASSTAGVPAGLVARSAAEVAAQIMTEIIDQALAIAEPIHDETAPKHHGVVAAAKAAVIAAALPPRALRERAAEVTADHIIDSTTTDQVEIALPELLTTRLVEPLQLEKPSDLVVLNLPHELLNPDYQRPQRAELGGKDVQIKWKLEPQQHPVRFSGQEVVVTIRTGTSHSNGKAYLADIAMEKCLYFGSCRLGSCTIRGYFNYDSSNISMKLVVVEELVVKNGSVHMEPLYYYSENLGKCDPGKITEANFFNQEIITTASIDGKYRNLALTQITQFLPKESQVLEEMLKQKVADLKQLSLEKIAILPIKAKLELEKILKLKTVNLTQLSLDKLVTLSPEKKPGLENELKQKLEDLATRPLSEFLLQVSLDLILSHHKLQYLKTERQQGIQKILWKGRIELPNRASQYFAELARTGDFF